ncbi:hypothetical protein SBP18_18085 [Rhodoferax ferrireducens]|nr:hypothetical protein [Rhodoferax ferrireducens]WPC66372.1 hypothetical protein SBP18_18085 [Rhodoferax ferrireducens]
MKSIDGGKGLDDSAAITLHADYRFKAEWLLSLPECRAGMPKL